MEQEQYEWQVRQATWPIFGPTFRNLNPSGPKMFNERREEFTEDDIEVGDTVELNNRVGESIGVRVDEIDGECSGTIMESGARTKFRKKHVFSFFDRPRKNTR